MTTGKINKYSRFVLGAALALAAAPSLFAGPVLYREAAAPWSAEQSLRLPPALTAGVLKDFEIEQGPRAAAELAAKKQKVAALVGRFRTCDLNGEDLQTAEKYLNEEFKARVRYFSGRGCAELKQTVAGIPAGAVSASLSELQGVSASGAFATAGGSARFFDGSVSGGRASAPVYRAGSAAAAGISAQSPAPRKPLACPVPALRDAAVRVVSGPAERPAGLGKDGRVNQAMNYWTAMRKESWEALKNGNLPPAEKAKAMARLTAGAGFGGLLYMSNLPKVEIAGARLRWDVDNGSGAGVIAADAARLAFNAGIFALALLPIPLTKIYAAVKLGEPWAIALVAAMAAGPLDRYVFHFAD